MYAEILARNAELLLWFKVFVTLAIVLGGGFSACFALWRRSEREVDELREINRHLHADCDKATAYAKEAWEEATRSSEGHRVALATLVEERKEAVPDKLSYTECEERMHKAAAELKAERWRTRSPYVHEGVMDKDSSCICDHTGRYFPYPGCIYEPPMPQHPFRYSRSVIIPVFEPTPDAEKGGE